MTDYIEQAMAIARAQAGVRPMTPEEVGAYVKELAQALAGFDKDDAKPAVDMDPKNSIGEAHVTCLECGKKFKVMTIRHLKQHGLTAKEYKNKWGLKKEVSLAAKGLVRMRRKKMREIRIWERKGKQ